MSEPVDRTSVQHMMRRLDGFARGLGLDEASTRVIVEKVAADMVGAFGRGAHDGGAEANADRVSVAVWTLTSDAGDRGGDQR